MIRQKLSITACAVAGLLVSLPGFAHSVKHKVSNYAGNDDLARRRYTTSLDLGFDRSGETLGKYGFGASISNDFYQYEGARAEEDFIVEHYSGGKRTEHTVALTANQTFNRITDLRQMVSLTRDNAGNTRSASAGGSQWLFHETMQFSLDVSRTITEKPEFEYLDVDTELVSLPDVLNSTGVTLGVRHLTTPTTITIGTLSQVQSNDRPLSRTISLELRQFVTPADGALHLIGARGINHGRITTATSYGEVDSWQGEIAWLQNLGASTRGKVSYRYYKELEKTRAYEDELQFGSDTVGVNLAHDLNAGIDWTVEAGFARYVTNTGVSAAIADAGVTAKF